MEFITQALENASGFQIIMLCFAVLLLWFLPALISLFLNRQHAKYIFLACIPAGFSLIAWSGVLVWSITGNAVNRFRKKTTSA